MLTTPWVTTSRSACWMFVFVLTLLPLLALMPRLAPAGQAKRLLLRTAIQRPATLLGGLLLVGWSGAVSMHASWPVALAMLAAAMGCLGYLVAMALCSFGGRPLSTFGKKLLLIGLFALLSFTVLSAQWSGDWSALLTSRAEHVLGIA